LQGFPEEYDRGCNIANAPNDIKQINVNINGSVMQNTFVAERPKWMESGDFKWSTTGFGDKDMHFVSPTPHVNAPIRQANSRVGR
jgi:hypothetical protein